MRYLLSPRYRLRGWDKLPLGVFDAATRRCDFYGKKQFKLLMRCDGMQDIDPDTLTEEQHAWIGMLVQKGIVTECGPGAILEPVQLYRRYPCRHKRDVHWSITGKCNYRCKHCLVSAPHAKFGHPTTEQLLDLVDQMAECGIGSVSITGGEPLIRSDFWQVVDALEALDIRLSIVFSNGYLVDDALLDGFEARDLHPAFQMSYDGMAGTTGCAGSQASRRPWIGPSPCCSGGATMRTLRCACTGATSTPSERLEDEEGAPFSNC